MRSNLQWNQRKKMKKTKKKNNRLVANQLFHTGSLYIFESDSTGQDGHYNAIGAPVNGAVPYDCVSVCSNAVRGGHVQSSIAQHVVITSTISWEVCDVISLMNQLVNAFIGNFFNPYRHFLSHFFFLVFFCSLLLLDSFHSLCSSFL